MEHKSDFQEILGKEENQHWGVRAQGVSEKVSVTSSSEKNWAAGGVIFAHFRPNPNTKEDSPEWWKHTLHLLSPPAVRQNQRAGGIL